MNILDRIAAFFRDFGESFSRQFQSTFIVDDRWQIFLEGLGNTLLIALFATMIGVAIGSLVAVVKVYAVGNRKLRFLEIICNLYTTVIRGTPVVVQLFIMYFIIFKSQTEGIAVAVAAFGINSGAYVSEIIRSGIMAVDKGQTEAGRSLGLTQNNTMRLIVFPQAIKNILPALGNEFISLLKETSVAGFVGVRDLTRAQNIVSSRTFDYTFPLFAIALIYLAVVMLMTKLLRYFERRLAKSDSR